MTVAATNVVNSYMGTSSANSYVFSFPQFQNTEIAVQVTSPTGTLYTLVLNIDYNVFGLNPSGAPPSSGSITLISSGQPWLTLGNLTTGWVITIFRNMTLTQLTSFRNQGDFYPETIESAMDNIVMLLQQLNAGVISQQYTSGGGGFVVTTPNGLHTYEIGVDNNGDLTSQQLT
jgi:hypothetical protein